VAGLPPALGMVSWGSVHASTWCPPCPGTGVWGLSPCLHMVPRLPPTGLRGPADCRHDHATPPPAVPCRKPSTSSMASRAAWTSPSTLCQPRPQSEQRRRRAGRRHPLQREPEQPGHFQHAHTRPLAPSRQESRQLGNPCSCTRVNPLHAADGCWTLLRHLPRLCQRNLGVDAPAAAQLATLRAQAASHGSTRGATAAENRPQRSLA